jgi:hypothetical protein
LTSTQLAPPPFGGSGFSPQLPNLNIPFGSQGMPDLSELYQILAFITPAGTFRPHFDPHYLNNVYGAINDLLSKFMPFLMIYKFLLPVLNLILCIIEVLCALMNPFALSRAISRLFRVCIPEFLALFPFFALIIMIISLLLLIISLIIYLIERIIIIMEILIANVIALGRAVQRNEGDSIVAILIKIGDLLCFLQNLFIIFGVILLIVEIIKAILSLGFNIPPCGSGSSCCDSTVCPQFIQQNGNLTSSTGNFLYYNQVGIDSGLILPAGFPPIVKTVRSESWQFYDPKLTQSQAFINITNAFDLPAGTSKVFFPGGTNYTASTSPSSVPYTISFRFFYNPTAFNVTDLKGPRYVRANNVIVQNPPTSGVASYTGHGFVAPFNGTIDLIGGTMTEDDGTDIINSQGQTTTLNAFIHIPVSNSGVATNDGVLFSDLTYTFTINYEVLMGASLITVGCMPSVTADKDFINNTLGTQFNTNGTKLAAIPLPDIATAQDCLTSAVTQFTQSISVDTANAFQSNITNCLNTLQDQAQTALVSVINAGYDPYKSTFSLDPAIQFTSLPIVVSISLNESSGQSMTTNLPGAAAAQLATGLSGVATLGTLGQFSYDGHGLFLVNITSNQPGNGKIKIAFDNSYISVLNNPTDITQSPSVIVTEVPYTFVSSPAISSGQPRRNEGDIAREGAI